MSALGGGLSWSMQHYKPLKKDQPLRANPFQCKVELAEIEPATSWMPFKHERTLFRTGSWYLVVFVLEMGSFGCQNF